MDSVKPLDKRRGWSAAQVGEHNRERFEDLISAGWDLVIVDEAHRLGGSTDQVARFKLGQGLSEAAPYLLLLSATPHQGKTDAFHRLVSLLDAQEFPDIGSVTRERVQPYVIRTEKRRAIDAEGKPLFKPRRTQLGPVSWEERHRSQQLLYEAVTEYVREGYNQAMREKRSYIGFLMILMQRLVVSSTSAIRTTLERRLEALAAPEEQLTLFPLTSDEEWADLDGQEQLDVLLRTRLQGAQERARRGEAAAGSRGPLRAGRAGRQGRGAARLALPPPVRGGRPGAQGAGVHRVRAHPGDAAAIPDRARLLGRLPERLHGHGRAQAGPGGIRQGGPHSHLHRRRRGGLEPAVLPRGDQLRHPLESDAARAADRPGGSYRPAPCGSRGQLRLRGLGRAPGPGGAGSRSSPSSSRSSASTRPATSSTRPRPASMFDEMYVEAILNPDKVEDSVESVVARLQEQAREARTTASVLGATEDLEPGEAQRLLTHPLPHWVERMTVSYLKAHGGQAERKSQSWNLTWPDGETYKNVVFTGKEAERLPAARHLTLEEPKVRGLAMRLPRFAPGQPVPGRVDPRSLRGSPGHLVLWRIAIACIHLRRAGRLEPPQDHASLPGRQRHGLHADGQTHLGPAPRGKPTGPFHS